MSDDIAPEKQPRHYVGLLLVAGLIAWLSYLGYNWYTVSRFYEKTDNAYLEADITLVSSRVEGTIQKLNVENNQTVKAGDLLLQIDDKDYTLQVAQAQSAIDSEISTLDTLDAQLILQENVLDEARQDLDRTNSDAMLANQDLSRITALSQNKYASAQSLDEIQNTKLKADTEVKKSKSRIAQAVQQMDVLIKTKSAHLAKIHELKVSLDLAKRNQAYTKVYAPIEGVVGNKAANAGELVHTGEQLLSIVPLTDIYVVANYKETQISNMFVGQEAMITVDAIPDATFKGKILNFSPASGSRFSLLPPENASGNFNKVVQRIPVKLSITGSPENMARLKPGLSVIVNVDIRTTPEQKLSDYSTSPTPGSILNAMTAPNIQALDKAMAETGSIVNTSITPDASTEMTGNTPPALVAPPDATIPKKLTAPREPISSNRKK